MLTAVTDLTISCTEVFVNLCVCVQKRGKGCDEEKVKEPL